MPMNCTIDYEQWLQAWKLVKGITMALSIIPSLLCISSGVYLLIKIKRPEKSNPDGKYAQAINFLCFIAALLTFLRIGLDLELILGNKTKKSCTTAMRMKNILYITALNTLYMVLWLRQRVFYDNVALQYLRSVAVQVCSWSVLCFINGGALVMVMLYLLTVEYTATKCGCDSHDRAHALKYIGGLIGTVLAQSALLGLLLYPLLKRQNAALRTCPRTSDGKVARIFVKRACIAAFVCIFTDSLSSGMSLTFGKSEFYKIVYEVNLIVNLTAIICCFPDWKDRFLPCRMRNRIRGRSFVGKRSTIRVMADVRT